MMHRAPCVKINISFIYPFDSFFNLYMALIRLG